MEPRAAIAEYNEAEEHFTLYTTSQNPHVARLVLSAFYNIAPEHKLRVIAPDVGGGFGSKIFIYPEEMVALWASKKVRPPGEMDRRPHRSFPDRRPWPRSRHQGRDGFRQGQQDHSACGSKPTPISAPICRCSRRRCRPISMRRCCRASTTSPTIFAEVISVYTNTAPVDAYRGAGRPEASFVVERLMETAARQLKVDPAELRRKNFITQFPHQTPVIMAYDIGDFGASLDAAMKAIDYAGFAGAQGKGQEGRQAARHRRLLLHRGLRHRALEGGRQPRRRRRPVGIRRSARQSGRHHRGPHRIAQPRPGPRDDLRATGRRASWRSDQPGPDRPWRHRQGAVRHGHLRLALDRGRRAPPSSRRWRRWRPRPRRSPRISSRRPKTTSSSRTASSRSPAPTSRSRCRWSRSPPTPRTICPTAWSPA